MALYFLFHSRGSFQVITFRTKGIFFTTKVFSFKECIFLFTKVFFFLRNFLPPHSRPCPGTGLFIYFSVTWSAEAALSSSSWILSDLTVLSVVIKVKCQPTTLLFCSWPKKWFKFEGVGSKRKLTQLWAIYFLLLVIGPVFSAASRNFVAERLSPVSWTLLMPRRGLNFLNDRFSYKGRCCLFHNDRSSQEGPGFKFHNNICTTIP